MITPSKHLDLDRSALRVSSELLRTIRKRRIMAYDSVVSLIRKKAGDDGDVVVVPALNFLFVLGLIEYHPKTDTFEYLEPSQA